MLFKKEKPVDFDCFSLCCLRVTFRILYENLLEYLYMEFSLKSKVMLYPGMAGWHFVFIDKKSSEKIKKNQIGKKRIGWGSIPGTVTIGKTTWKTSIFPDKDGTYLLPIRAEIRKKEDVYVDDHISFTCILRK